MVGAPIYDTLFRQVAAATPAKSWAELDPSLHAATFLASCSTTGTHCLHCAGSDHVSHECALALIQSSGAAIPRQADKAAAFCPGYSPNPQPTQIPICTSWNRGKCAYAPSCTYRHICATCRRGHHQARECSKTPVDSIYKRPVPLGHQPSKQAM